jgi:hypothetical protein
VTHRAVATSSGNLAELLNDLGINRLNVDWAIEVWPFTFDRPAFLGGLPARALSAEQDRTPGTPSTWGRTEAGHPPRSKVDGASFEPSVFEIDHPLLQTQK